MASEIWVNVGTGNGLLPVGNNDRQQAITWTNVDLSSLRPIGIYLRVSSQKLL